MIQNISLVLRMKTISRGLSSEFFLYFVAERWECYLSPEMGLVPTAGINYRNRGLFIGYWTRKADFDISRWMAWQHGGLGPMQGQANRELFS
jgi:hypothetical protein